MKILFLNRAAAATGGEMNQYVIDVAHRLQEAGDSVALVHDRDSRVEFDGTRYAFSHLDEMKAEAAQVKVRLDAIIEDFTPDVIQLHGVGNSRLDRWCRLYAPTVRFIHNHRYYCSGEQMTWRQPRRMCERPHGRPCLYHHLRHGCGSVNPVANALRYRWVTASVRNLRKLEHLQVASRMMRENLMRNGIDPRRIEVLPLYAPAPEEPRAATGARRRVIFHPGALVPNKGVWLMAKSLDALPADVDLVFGGSGDLEAALEAYAMSRGLSDRIRIVGEVDPGQRSRLYQQADLVVLPSMWNEPLGLSGLHAMAHGKPVIAFQSSGINEWLQHGVTGYAVAFGDRKAFISKVAEALGEPAALLRMGEAGRRAWEKQFRPRQHMDRLRACYARIVEKRSPSSGRK